MPNKFVGAFKFFTKKKGTVAPTITQPRQLKTTMKRIESENKRFGFTKAKTATDRANIVRRKKSIERMEKLDKAKAKVKTGEKGKKEIQKMVDTKQATKVGGEVFHKSVRDKKMFGGLMQKVKDKKLKDKEKKKSIKEKIMPKKKMDRLKELKKELE